MTELAREKIAGVSVFNREEFIHERWSYPRGDHVTFLGPTGSGKTMLTYQLLEVTARPKLPAIVLAMKPRDETVTRWNERLKFRTVRTWPPAPSMLTWWRDAKPPGWTLWPRHTFDPDQDTYHLYSTFRAAILDSYRRGGRILVADELYGMTDELHLRDELVAVWSRGRSMGCGLWGGTQRPAFIPSWAYGNVQHLFLANDPDERAQKRFSEIGGVDPKKLREIVPMLPKHWWLYVRRDGPRMAIVRK